MNTTEIDKPIWKRVLKFEKHSPYNVNAYLLVTQVGRVCTGEEGIRACSMLGKCSICKGEMFEIVHLHTKIASIRLVDITEGEQQDIALWILCHPNCTRITKEDVQTWRSHA